MGCLISLNNGKNGWDDEGVEFEFNDEEDLDGYNSYCEEVAALNNGGETAFNNFIECKNAGSKINDQVGTLSCDVQNELETDLISFD